ncbi:MAG TPA: Na+/H+ antiporter subunit E [Bacteroidetes bacterium]|mgnify:CR=1 FL=1|nr:Na+/H+ antiporter subunit E [Bacteroidota bacterium]
MKEKEKIHVHPAVNFIYLFVILMTIWMALTRSLSPPELIAGFAVSLVLSLLLYRNFEKAGFPPIPGLKKIGYSLLYAVVLLKEIILANLDVAYRVLHPKMPIKPGIVIIKTGLKQDLAKLILANSITLTPGTFTLDIEDDRLLIHWINVKTDNVEEATRMIGERFERYLRIIFQ